MPFEFSFTDEQDKFRRDTREFLHSEILPSINTYDKMNNSPFKFGIYEIEMLIDNKQKYKII